MAILEQFEKVPARQRALILGVLVALIGGLYWQFAYSPKAKQIAAQKQRRDALDSEVQNLRSIEAKNREWQRKIADQKVKLDAARQQLPGEKEIPKLLEEIARFGKESGVEFISFRPQTETKKDFYNEVPMSLAIRGPFHNIGMFLDKISNYPRIISVTNLGMGTPQEKEGYLMLTSTCLATTYRYVEN